MRIRTILLFTLYSLLFTLLSFAQEQTPVQPEQQPEQAVEIPVIDTKTFIWLEDSLEENATTTGEWIWAQDIKFSGEASHTDGIKEGLHSHSFKVSVPIKLKTDSAIEQYVYLDPDNPPKGIMLKLITADGKNIDIYWEAEEEVFVGTVEYMEAWYMGVLPQPGQWQRLVINMQELEIAPVELVGISFISYDGRTYWDRTLVMNPAKE